MNARAGEVNFFEQLSNIERLCDQSSIMRVDIIETDQTMSDRDI